MPTAAFRRVLGITPSEWMRMMLRRSPLGPGDHTTLTVELADLRRDPGAWESEQTARRASPGFEQSVV